MCVYVLERERERKNVKKLFLFLQYDTACLQQQQQQAVIDWFPRKEERLSEDSAEGIRTC